MCKGNFFQSISLVIGVSVFIAGSFVACGNHARTNSTDTNSGNTPTPPPSSQGFDVWSFNMEGSAKFPAENYPQFLSTNKIGKTQLPDFIGTQEDDYKVGSYLVKALQDVSQEVSYKPIGRARGGVNSPNEKNTIIYNANKWSLDTSIDQKIISSCLDIRGTNKEGDTNKLSPIISGKPITDPGENTCNLSSYYDNNGFYSSDKNSFGPYSRIVTWGIFQDVNNPNREVAVINTHLPLRSQHATQETETNIMKYVVSVISNNKKNIPIILTGDFNSSTISYFTDFKSANFDGVIYVTSNSNITQDSSKNSFYSTCDDSNYLNCSKNNSNTTNPLVSDHRAVVNAHFSF